MRTNIANISKDLNRVTAVMHTDGLNIGLVGYIGNTELLGRYFAESFCCEAIRLPSAKRKGATPWLARALNGIYPYFPEPALRALSHFYRLLYSSSERVLPNTLNLDDLAECERYLTMVLVDDNTYTGKTMELWKAKLKSVRPDIDVITFSAAVTGEYKPDYYCFTKWRSFEWRPIGI